jgi:outer membrane immunogenic protein
MLKTICRNSHWLKNAILICGKSFLMKNTILAITAFITAIQVSLAQQKISEGLTQYNVGIGASNRGVPFYLGADFGVYDNITVGGEFSIRSYQSRYYDYVYRNRLIGFNANGNYHFNEIAQLPKEFDFYAGLMLGLYVWDGSPEYNHGAIISGGGQVGGRYRLRKNIHLNAELQAGGAFSGLKLGVTFRP